MNATTHSYPVLETQVMSFHEHSITSLDISFRAISLLVCAIFCKNLLFSAFYRCKIRLMMSNFAIYKEASMSIFYQNSGERLRLYTSQNNTYASHLHKQVELIVVLEGSLTITADQKQYKMNKHQGIMVFPNRLHSLYTDPDIGSHILLCIFETDFCPHYRKYFQSYIPDKFDFNLTHLSPHSRLAVEQLHGLTECFERGKPIPAYISSLAEGYLSLLLADLFTPSSESSLHLHHQKGGEDLELEQQVLIYLDEHFTEELSLELLSKEFGVSRFRLSRLFSDKLQTGFPSYVTAKRLEYARELLSTTDQSVTNIALDAGFGSSRSFFREFKTAFHMTPNEYRKQHIK